MNSLLPATEQLSRDIDLNTVAIFDVDDSEGAKYLYLSALFWRSSRSPWRMEHNLAIVRKRISSLRRRLGGP